MATSRNLRRQLVLVTAVSTAALTAAACGTRVTDARIQKAAGIGAVIAQTGGSSQSGLGATVGSAPATGATTGGAAPVTGTTPTGTTSAGTGATTTGSSTGSTSTGTTSTGTTSTGTSSTGSTTSTGTRPTGTSTGTKSSGKTGKSAPSAAASTAAATNGPATGTPINLGVIGTFSGAVGAFVSDTVKGMQVWAQYQNAHGGVAGHPVNVIVGDDGGDPAKFNSLEQQFVTQNHVIAMLYTTLGFAPNGNNSYLDSQKILTFETEGGLDTTYQDPWVLTPIPSGHSYADVIIDAAAKIAVPQGKTKLATLACSDFSLCDNFDSEWSQPAVQQATGFTNVYRARPSLTQPDFTAQCLSAQQAGAQVMLLAMDTASDQRIADACVRQNYKPLYVVPDLLALPSLLSDANLNGAVVATKLSSFVDTSVPGIAAYRQAYAQYAPSLSPDSGSAAAGWTAGMFFAAAGKNLPANNPTPADVLAGLRKINNDTLDGLTYPLNYTPSQQTQKKVCFSVAQVQNGKYVTVPGMKLTCTS